MKTQTLININARLAALNLPGLTRCMLMEQAVWDKVVHWTDDDTERAELFQTVRDRLKTLIDLLGRVQAALTSNMGAVPAHMPFNLSFTSRKDGSVQTATLECVAQNPHTIVIQFPNNAQT